MPVIVMETTHIMRFNGVKYLIPRIEIPRFYAFVKLMCYRDEMHDHIEFSDAFSRYKI